MLFVYYLADEEWDFGVVLIHAKAHKAETAGSSFGNIEMARCTKPLQIYIIRYVSRI